MYTYKLQRIVTSTKKRKKKRKDHTLETKRWRRPPEGFVKCNVGSSWTCASRPCGVSWILRDSNGVPILHSRRAYSYIRSKEEANLYAMLWAVEIAIATSVTTGQRYQSYVAAKGPAWLSRILFAEAAPFSQDFWCRRVPSAEVLQTLFSEFQC
ncbi:hypothetical protein HID58_015473 [Brassica napus]|uniref:RNase H type-1 domain-containing protein n=1 Tax=Brassica napus TaxID=3708 RepID=A0ABQ8DK47_BRANA|nr:hypothetical protein HID58_015473 [Brassica napus]